MIKKSFIRTFLGIVAAVVLCIETCPCASAGIIGLARSRAVDKLSVADKVRVFRQFLNQYAEGIVPMDLVRSVCKEVTPIISEEPQVVNVEGSSLILGGTQSDLESLMCGIFKFLDKVGSGMSVVFLGDYVDNGQYCPGGANGVNNVMLVFKLKTLFPDQVVLLRGTHEHSCINRYNGFYRECQSRYSKRPFLQSSQAEEVFNTINSAFNCLSLVARINEKTLCLHGGISQGLVYLDQLNIFSKSVPADAYYKNNVYQGVLSATPARDDKYFSQRCIRGNALSMFGIPAFNEFCEKNNVERVIRTHEYCTNGWIDHFGDGKMHTIVSVSQRKNKKDRQGTTGAILNLAEDGTFKVETFQYSYLMRRKIAANIKTI